MKKNDFYVFIAASIAMLVPAPGRLSCGIVLVVGIMFFILVGTLFRKLIQKLALFELQPVLIAVLLVAAAILYKQLIIMMSPVLGLMLGFNIYLAAISSFMIGYLYEKSTKPLNEELSENLKKGGQFSLFALVFFLFRDIFGYGTITIPARKGMHELVLYHNAERITASIFWASIPGALVLTALLLVLFVHVTRMFTVIENSNPVKDGDENAKKEEAK